MPFRAALARILRPLIRTAMARGVAFPEMSDWLKRLYVECAEADFGIEGKRMTDSRIALLTGLQRRDVKAHRDVPHEDAPVSAGPLPRIVARWLADAPRSLTRADFEVLAASVSRDMHPRTMLDELVRQGAVALDGDRVTLMSDGYLPEEDDAQLGYFGANLGDHAEAAMANLAATPAPFFERAVHYNGLSEVSLQVLEQRARVLQSEVLKTLNAEALRLQQRDANVPDATGRFRCGAFVYTEIGETI